MINYQVLRRINGVAGSPAAAGALEGMFAVNIPGAPGTTAPAALYVFDGNAWRDVGQTSINTQSVNLDTPGGATVGPAATAWIGANAPFTGDLVVASYGGQAYLLTNPAAPGVDASWTVLGAATTFASAAEVLAGTATNEAIDPAGLQSRLTDTPDATPANDARKLVQLNAAGQIDAGFIPISGGVNFQAAADLAQPPVPPAGGFGAGDFVVHSGANGAIVDAGWTGPAAGATVDTGDMALFDGTNWHVIQSVVDMSAYLPLAGGTMTDTAVVNFANPAVAPPAPVVRIDGGDPAMSALDNFTLDAGVYAFIGLTIGASLWADLLTSATTVLGA